MTKRTRAFRKFMKQNKLKYREASEFLDRAEQTVRRWGADIAGRPQEIPKDLFGELKKAVEDGII